MLHLTNKDYYLISKLRKFNNYPAIEAFLTQAKLLIDTLKLDSDTPNFLCTLPEKSRNMNIQFTNKYILVVNLEGKTPSFWYAMPNKGENYYKNKKLQIVHSSELETLNNGTKPLVLGFEVFDFEKDIKDLWLETAKEALKSYKTNSKKYKFNHELYKLITDSTYRNELFAFAQSNQPIPALPTNMQQDEPNTKNTNPPLNQILFGAPGTGKTYHTVNEAIEIMQQPTNPAQLPLFSEGKGLTRKDTKRAFDAYVAKKNIQFVTFHQSFGYEDFVEGIKPVTANGQVSYEIQDGIFKRMCIEAKYELYRLQKDIDRKKDKEEVEEENDDTEEQVIDFDDLWLNFVHSLSTKHTFKTKNNAKLDWVKINESLNIAVKHQNNKKEYIVSKNRMEKVYEYFESVDDIKNVTVDIGQVIGGANYTAYWAVFNELKIFERTFLAQNILVEEEDSDEEYEIITDYSDKKALVADFNFQEVSQEVYQKAKKYVLIIDEINRGNVAQIFGELITLIEESKRAGKDEAIELVLPYSKDAFSVPANLYLIGTMNTADRSVEALDTALRRRFSFKEMRPDYTILPTVEGVEVGKMLQTINARIELLLDKEHAIGHSYFLGLATIEDLRLAFENKLIPLLQEYFFGDFSKIGLVLGEAFVAPQKQDKKDIFAPFALVDKNLRTDLLRREVYHFTESEKWDATAFQGIYS